MKYSRRKFLNSAGITGLFGISSLLYSCSETKGLDGILMDEEEGEILYIGNERKAKITIKISGRSHPSAPFSLLTEIISPGDYIPEHKHLSEDEFIFIIRGIADVQNGDEVRKLKGGGMAFIPRATWHGLRNEGNDYVHMVFGYSPAGFEDYFRQIGVKSVKDKLGFSQKDWDRTSRKYDVIFR